MQSMGLLRQLPVSRSRSHYNVDMLIITNFTVIHAPGDVPAILVEVDLSELSEQTTATLRGDVLHVDAPGGLQIQGVDPLFLKDQLQLVLGRCDHGGEVVQAVEVFLKAQ